MKNLEINVLQADYHADSLKQIIIGIKNSIKTFEDRLGKLDWYDGLWLLEDTEPVFGLAFIAFQNYINTSINELYESIDNRANFYKLGPRSAVYNRSYIELIIGLANYTKHKDDDKLHNGTQNILNSFNLEPSTWIEDSPIFEGLTILNEKWDLLKIYYIVIDWRKDLFENYIEQTPPSYDK